MVAIWNLLHIAYSITLAIVREWAMSRMGKAGMPWVLPSVKTSSKFLFFLFILFFLGFFFPCCPLGIMGKRRVILQVFFFFFFEMPIQKLHYQKNPKKKGKKKLHYISWPPTTLKVFWSRFLWLLIRSFKQKP